ncbi:Cupin domain-containing protein [Mucilaginibacter yixingensis]|uniref:Cupin domain-containing protein n=1 Tax=Mucilaginibacter yixingensis TaxID=1295612 RepID=A0A2T5JAX1_9SPHI|nr:cupin domain-containing protein [Mucilaginibacter yixingensis]PTQ98022.1 Cupin domain-containing protein [Mucilaginibacter yixingensis]
MKNKLKVQHLLLVLWCIIACIFSAAATTQSEGFIIEHEQDIKKAEPGSHNGGGNTTAVPFFSKDQSLKIAFRKRILHPGSSIGYHLQKEDEIYYILSGNGILQMNGKDIPVTTGDAILTKPGSSHGLKPAGNEDLAVLITYDLK